MAGRPSGQFVVVLVTCPRTVVARKLAAALVQHRVAACVNVVPRVESFFRWQGKIERASEALLVIKTRKERFKALRRRVLSLHPYEVPEIIALPVIAGHRPYLTWVAASVSGKDARDA